MIIERKEDLAKIPLLNQCTLLQAVPIFYSSHLPGSKNRDGGGGYGAMDK